ncbi:hypothetical protein BH10ACI3_BH10ACI3_17350 [soil metagenome]
MQVLFIQTELFDLPEFKSFVAVKKIRVNHVRSTSFLFVDRKLPLGMNFSNLTFRDLLNSVTVGKRGGWLIKTKKSDVTDDRVFEVIDLVI